MMLVPTESRSAVVALILKVTGVAFVVTVPDVGDAVSQLGTLVIEYFRLPLTALSE
jgi:hypothetical protein